MNLETNWMSKSELKDYLGFSMGKIETMMKSNQLPYYKVGKNVKLYVFKLICTFPKRVFS